MTDSPLRVPLDFLVGGVEMGKLIGAMDCSRSPLGAVESWPQSLRTLPEGSNRARIVLADDDADLRGYAARILEECGYAVHAVADGEAALAAARAAPVPDLVLTDATMPRLDGFGVLKALRADPAMEGLLVILLSARAGEAARVEGLVAGADDYLVKPFTARELIARVDGAVHLVKLRREAATRERDLLTAIVTEQARAELHESEVRGRFSEEKYHVLMEQAQDAILMLDPQGVVLEANRKAELMLNRPRADIVGCSLKAFTGDAHAAELSRLLAGDSAKLSELRLTRDDGKTINVEGSAVRVPVNGQEIVLFIARDITERLSLEHQLRHAQKMDAIGQLTGGIAHDFNNLLGVVIGNLELLGEIVSANPKGAEFIEAALMGATRGAELTRRMLAFARKQPLRARPFQLNDVVAGMVSMLRRTLGETIEIGVALAEKLWPCLADPAQVEDVVLNLALNARDAMPQGGRLIIETANVNLDERYAAKHADLVPGEYVLLSVSDTGVGMPPDVVGRAFEPFFTTKEAGRGTGLGLSMVYGFAKQSRGHVNIYSEVDRGTTLKVYLPRAVSAEAPVGIVKLADPAGGGETILVVEDDPAVRQMVMHLLESFGYRVLQAANGQAALEILRQEAQVDLLFTDLVLPKGLSGYDLAEIIRQERPDVKIVLTSGYSDRLLREESGHIHLIGKPYRKQDLAQKIRAVLDEGLIRSDDRRQLE